GGVAGRRQAGAAQGPGWGSPGSWPAMTSRISARSASERGKARIWSSLRDSGSTPARETSPWLGLIANTPQKAAGRMTDPLVWLPSASGTIWAATAAADPDDEPPGGRPWSCGLPVTPGWEYANSVVTVLPMMTAPAARNFATTVASSRGRRPAPIGEPYSVG